MNPKITDLNKQINVNMTKSVNYLANSFSRPFTRINWQCTSTNEIEKIVKPLSTKNTTGYDEISNRIMKISTPFII